MTIKNADMPAIPLSGKAYGDFVGGHKHTLDASGLTKREMFAMRVMSSMQAKDYQCAKYMAQDAVAMADALLEELSK